MESIARLIYSPIHVDLETGQVKELAFSDVKDKGLSVQRTPLSSSADIRAIGERKLRADHDKGYTDREFLGIVRASVEQVRELTYEEGGLSFCVYDSALPLDTAHADVCQTDAKPSAMKRARKKLRDLFGHNPIMP